MSLFKAWSEDKVNKVSDSVYFQRRAGDLILFEALTGGAFDHLSWQHSGEFDQNFSKESNARGFARGGMGGFGIDRYITYANSLGVFDFLGCVSVD